jgi:hypothetical protein
MKKITTTILLLFIMSSNAQIGDGWDWAFNTGTLGGATIKHMKYSSDGSEILFGGNALAAAYFGTNTITAPKQLSFPGSIKFFGKINTSTGAPTIIRSFINLPVNFDCITTDAAGNFYIGGAISDINPVDLGNGVSVSGINQSVIAKFDATGNTIWAKTYTFGASGNAQTNVLKLAVSNAGNVFFWGFNPNSDANSKRNSPLYKLDSNGNTLWFKEALNDRFAVSNAINEYCLTDKFIDDSENVHLFVLSTGGYTFDGVAHPGGSSSYGASTLISLNAAGTIVKAQTFDGTIKNFQVIPTTGNLIFRWNQINPNGVPFTNLPHPMAAVQAFYANAFTGMVETDKDFNFIKAKDYSTILDNPFQINSNEQTVLALPNGKLIHAFQFVKTANYSAGTDYLYPIDATKYAIAIVETDTNWNIAKFISGGKAPTVAQSYLAAYNDTYAMAATFYAEDVANPTTNPPLPTTSYGTVNLTGFNAAPDLTTAYGIYSTSSSLRSDVAVVQTKSPNFPMIASTTWLGNSTNWNDASNWSNGVPTNATKALFNQATANYPTVSTTPTAASLEVNSGVSLTLPTTLALSGGIKNDGTIILNNAGFFQGFGTKEWNGSGSVNFTGSQVSFFYPSLFSNSLVLNTNLTTFYDLIVPTVSLTTAKINLNNKKLSITDSSPTAILGASTTNYVYGGTLERKINPTGNYEFPMGDFSKMQSATISTNNLTGVDKIAVKYTNGAITGTTPNTTYSGATITNALNGGWFSITPNQLPTSGNYDAILKIQSSSNTSATVGNYIVIKRDNSTSAWSVSGNYTLASVASGIVTARNNGLTSFSDFAIGIASSEISLSNMEFLKQQLTIYPNPASEQVNLSFKTILDNVNVKIISTTGQAVYQKSNLSGDNLSLNVSDLAKGIYIIQVSDGISVSNSKFIKQ